MPDNSAETGKVELRGSQRQETTTNLLHCSFLTLQIFHQIFPKRYKINTLAFVGPVAQRLEQRTHNAHEAIS